jgi:hypothetical protein
MLEVWVWVRDLGMQAMVLYALKMQSMSLMRSHGQRTATGACVGAVVGDGSHSEIIRTIKATAPQSAIRKLWTSSFRSKLYSMPVSQPVSCVDRGGGPAEGPRERVLWGTVGIAVEVRLRLMYVQSSIC